MNTYATHWLVQTIPASIFNTCSAHHPHHHDYIVLLSSIFLSLQTLCFIPNFQNCFSPFPPHSWVLTSDVFPAICLLRMTWRFNTACVSDEQDCSSPVGTSPLVPLRGVVSPPTDSMGVKGWNVRASLLFLFPPINMRSCVTGEHRRSGEWKRITLVSSYPQSSLWVSVLKILFIFNVHWSPLHLRWHIHSQLEDSC